MLKKNGLAFAIATVLGTTATIAGAAESTGALEEIVVTAQRRSESIQNVPITIQAITGDALTQMSIATFDDVLRLLPNVTFGSNGPGQGNIFMRGLSAGFAGNQSSATDAPMPNVATYYDDQAMSFPARNADVYMADMERIEVLEGPQGTLFGGGAEAGAVRYITNKPKLNVFEGNADASYGTTAHGDPNTALTGVINLPLIKDKLSVRLVAYNDHRGGYIDNVATTFTRKASDPGNGYWGGAMYPASALVGPSANNYSVAARAQNPTTYSGMRASALYQINDDWNVLIQQTYQNLDAEGMNAQYPIGSDGQTLNPWEETSFSQAYSKDKYSTTAWTVNGKFGDLHAVYTGSYLTRQIEQNMDYTNYARTAYGFYYTCSGGMMASKGGFNSSDIASAPCYSPKSSWHDSVHNTHQSHEFRLTTPDDWRLRGVVGAFYEKFDIKDNQNFMYKSIPSCTDANLAAQVDGLPICLANVIPVAGTASTDPTMRNDNVAYGQDIDRNFTQTAFFGSLDYDLLPKVLTATVGTRYYRYAQSMFGSRYLTSTPNVNVPNGSVMANPITLANHSADFHGFRSRANLTWHVTPDVMVYYTFSQGFRPGSFNRIASNKTKIWIDSVTGQAIPNGVDVTTLENGTTKVRQFQVPYSYAPDSLINNEIGFKSEFLQHRLQVNGSYYQMDWKDVQTLIYNPTVFGNGTFGVPGPTYRVKGFELQFIARVTDGLTLQGSLSHNNAKQTNQPCITSAGTKSSARNPVPAGQCLTQMASGSFNVPIIAPLGTEGATPAFSPTIQYNFRMKYDWSIGDYKAFSSLGGSHTGEMDNEPSNFVSGAAVAVPTTTWMRYTQAAYTTYDGSLGVAKDNWSVELYGQNLSNVNASLFTSSSQWIKSEVPTRPRVLGIKIGMKF